MADTNTTPDERLRGSIATKILLYGTIALGVVAVTLIIGALAVGTDKDKSIAIVANVFNALLPVIATWVGTVIAFYFGKENFAAASKSVQDMVTAMTSDQKLKSISAKDKNVIIPLVDIKAYQYIEANVKTVLLSDIIKFMDTNKVMRLPFMDAGNVLKYCIHRSIFDKYISAIALNNDPAKPVSALTFGSFLTSGIDEIQSYLNDSVLFEKEDATLFDVKRKMDSSKFCEDVFLTKTGSKDEAVIGWITNGKVMENMQV